MGLLARLLGAGRTQSVEAEPQFGPKAVERIAAVGESHYQSALRSICGAKVGEAVRFECFAALVPEPDNPYDPKAIRVEVERKLVGYLSRDDAEELNEAIVEAAQREQNGLVRAMIAGREDGQTTNLGVFLELTVAREKTDGEAT
jgi:HIRAN domain